MNAKNRRKSDSFTPGRSENADDYQHVPRAVTALARDQEAGAYNEPHTHARAQLLYATRGLMRVASNNGIWFIPPTRGLWIPADTVHDQLIVTPVQMRTLYIEESQAARLGDKVRVIEVSSMLRELILALIEEPIEYADNDKNRAIVTLILHQLEICKTIPLEIPWPSDRRLRAVCQAILDAPEQAMSIEYWADQAGASTRTLIRLFLSETGLTFRQWVQQVKLANALSRLEEGVPIATLADGLGYASPSAFSAMFKRVLGESPTSYLAQR